MASTTRNITTNVVLNGINNLSGPIGRGVNKSISSLDKLGNRMRMISYGAINVGRTMGVVGLGIAAPLIYAGKKAADFEDKMASVAKVANVSFGSDEFKNMGKDVRALSIYLGNTALESAALYETLAQSGTAKKDLFEIAKLAGQVSIAFDISAESAGNAFGYIKNIMNLTTEQTRLTADAINVLSNTRPAKAERILIGLSSGAASVARSYGLMGNEIAAMVATLIVNGKSGEEAATVMERFALGIRKNASWTKTYTKAGKGMAGMLAIINEGMASKNPGKYFDKMGMYGNDVKTLGLTMKDKNGLLGALMAVSDATKIAGSAEQEFSVKQKSTLSFLRREWARFNSTMIDFGDKVLPIVRDLVTEISPLIGSLGDWIKANPIATTGAIKLAAGMAALSFAVSGGAFLIGGLATSVRAFAAVAGWIVSQGWVITLASGMKDLFIASSILTFPIWGVAAAIAGLGYVAYKTSQDIGYLPKELVKIYTGTKAFLRNTLPALTALKNLQFDKAIAISARADMEADIDYNRIWNGGAPRMSLEERRGNRGYGPQAFWKKPEDGGYRSDDYINPPLDRAQSFLRYNPGVPLPDSLSFPAPAAAAPRSDSAGKSSIYNFKPSITINGSNTPEMKTMIEQANREAQREFEKSMIRIEEERNRRAIK